MKVAQNSYMFSMIVFELQDIVGREYVSTRAADKETYSIDFFWIPEMWHDRQSTWDLTRPMADVIVHPADADEVSKVLKIANNYKIGRASCRERGWRTGGAGSRKGTNKTH